MYETLPEKIDFFLNELEKQCEKRFPGSGLAEPANGYVFESISSDRWKRLQQWGRKGSYEGYVKTMISRQLTDFQRQMFGRMRLPKPLKALCQANNLAHKVCQLYLQNNYTRHEILDVLCGPLGKQKRSKVNSLFDTILSYNPKKPTYDEPFQPLDNDKEIPDEASPDRGSVFELLMARLLGENLELPEPYDRLIQRLNLSDQESQFLNFRFVDNLTAKESAQQAGITDSPYVYQKKLLDRIFSAFRKQGIDSPEGIDATDI